MDGQYWVERNGDQITAFASFADAEARKIAWQRDGITGFKFLNSRNFPGHFLASRKDEIQILRLSDGAVVEGPWSGKLSKSRWPVNELCPEQLGQWRLVLLDDPTRPSLVDRFLEKLQIIPRATPEWPLTVFDVSKGRMLLRLMMPTFFRVHSMLGNQFWISPDGRHMTIIIPKTGEDTVRIATYRLGSRPWGWIVGVPLTLGVASALLRRRHRSVLPLATGER